MGEGKKSIFSLLDPFHTTFEELENGSFTLKALSVNITPEKCKKTQQSTVILDLFWRKTRLENRAVFVTPLFFKSFVFKTFSVETFSACPPV